MQFADNAKKERTAMKTESQGRMVSSVKKSSVGFLAVTGILSAIAYILMWIEFPIPFLMPPFIKFDFSDFPALIAAFALGPVSGILVELIKNILHSFSSGSFGVGELSNFILGASFAGTAGFIYQRNKTKKGAIIASFVGAVVMAAISYPSNLLVVYPFYYNFMPKEVVLSAYELILPSIGSIEKALLIFNVPFTFVKGMIDVILCLLLYKGVSPFLHKLNGEG